MVQSQRTGVLVAHGYGVKVAVERGHLVVEDGVCEERHRRRFAKPTARLKRLVILGHTGFITLEALRWLKDVGAAFVQIDADGQVVVASGPVGLDDARLRRAQALAVTNGAAINMARELVRRKMQGQLSMLGRLPSGHEQAAVIRQKLEAVDSASDITRIRVVESAAALAYWQAWEQVTVRFVRRDESRVPDHWRTFGSRSSPLANGPRQAVNPANAILNYLYDGILEGEARIAALAMGLDQGLGVLHADQGARDSLSLDLMEPVRPEVDGYVLDLLQTRVFLASDFFETRQGVCRVLPPLTHALAQTATQWAQRVAPVAEWAAEMFAAAPGTRIIRKIPTLLTQTRRSAGRDRFRRIPRKKMQPPKPAPVGVCHSCGKVLASPERSYCDDCLSARKLELVTPFQHAGSMSISRLIAERRDPAHGGDARRKRAATISRLNKEAREWDERHTQPDPSEFARAILPGLREVSIQRMVEATGLSLRYCSLIRRGLQVPHPRHWSKFKQLLNWTGAEAW